MTAVQDSARAGHSFPEHGPVTVTMEDVVRWAAASGDFTPFHFDHDAAVSRGFEGPVVHGPWKAAMLRSLVQQWVGPVSLREFSAQYLAPDLVGEALVFGGEVVAVGRTSDGASEMHCALWVKRSDGTVSVRATATAVAEDELAFELPIERVKESVKVGEVAGTFTYHVDGSDIARFAEAISGRQVDRDQIGDAPTTFYAALDPVERRDLDLDGFVQNLPFPKIGGGNAFNEVSYRRPIRAGDVITVTTRYTEVYEKKGSKGTLLFRVRDNELHDAEGELVAITRCGHVLAYDLAAGTVGQA